MKYNIDFDKLNSKIIFCYVSFLYFFVILSTSFIIYTNFNIKNTKIIENDIEIDFDIYEKIIVDISKLGVKEKEFLISSIDKSFLIIYENEIDDIFSKYTNISIKKPFSKEQIKNYLDKKIPL